MTELLAAYSALATACRRLSQDTTGKAKRTELPPEIRRWLAGIEGTLARIDAEERRAAACKTDADYSDSIPGPAQGALAL